MNRGKTVFEEYLNSNEPQIQERARNWRTAIGLQAVDGLTVSDFLIDVARRNIEGEISFDEVDRLINEYYNQKSRAKIAKECSTYTIIDHVEDPIDAKRGRPI